MYRSLGGHRKVKHEKALVIEEEVGCIGFEKAITKFIMRRLLSGNMVDKVAYKDFWEAIERWSTIRL